MGIIGSNNSSYNDSYSGNYKGVSNYNSLASESGTITDLYTWAGSNHSGLKCKLGIYEGFGSAISSDDSRIYGSSEITATGSNYWHQISGLSIPIVSGRYYRLCFVTSPYNWYIHSISSGGIHSYQLGQAYEDEISSTVGNYAGTGSAILCIYAEYTADSVTGKPYYYFRNQ